VQARQGSAAVNREPASWLLWDGGCDFCRRAAAWVERHDRAGRFRVVPFQDAPSPPMTLALREACGRAVHVLRADGRVLVGGRACVFVLHRLGWRRTARVLACWPLVSLVELGYRVVAAKRPLFGRFLFRGD